MVLLIFSLSLINYSKINKFKSVLIQRVTWQFIKMAEVCVAPGQRVGTIADYDGGPGTYQRGNYLYSSLVGYKRILQIDQAEEQEDQAVCCNHLIFLKTKKSLKL